MAFAALSPQGLTIASGELGTGVIQTAIKASDMFLNLLLDPTIAGRSGGFTAASVTPTGYADEESLAYAARRTGTATDAFAMATKAPPLAPLHRWSVWASGYGGSETVGGNAVVGSQDLTARVWGVASGADYKVSPDTLFGFALGGGGTNYSLANAMGAGRTDMFNAGVYGRQNFGAAYLSGAFAYGWHDVTTNRTVPLAGVDMLQGRFQAETFSGRFEGGYRFATPFMGITPYAAAQVISVQLPNYSEVSQNGGGLFALNYASQTATDTRTELGLRADKSFAMADGVLTLRGRAAWAHDYDPNRAVTALFQALPGASFVVNGARPDAEFGAGLGLGRAQMAQRLLDRRRVRRRVLRQCHELRRQGRRQIQLVGRKLSQRLFVALPLPGHAEHHADTSRARLVLGGGLRHLHVELIDEQEGHAGFEVVQHLLQRRLLHLTADDEADETILGLLAEHVDL